MFLTGQIDHLLWSLGCLSVMFIWLYGTGIWRFMVTLVIIGVIIPVCTPTWGTVLEKNWSKIMTPNL